MGEAVISGCDSTKVFDASEHALDGVAVAVESRREAVFPAPVRLGWNVRRGTHALDLAPERRLNYDPKSRNRPERGGAFCAGRSCQSGVECACIGAK